MLNASGNVKVVDLTIIGYPQDNEGFSSKFIKTTIGRGKRKTPKIVYWGKW